jgi:hypothetical protein
VVDKFNLPKQRNKERTKFEREEMINLIVRREGERERERERE